MDNTYMYGNDVAEAIANPEATVTITQREYDDLIEDSTWLSALNQAGVDNWDGVDFAQEIYDAFNQA